MEIIIHNNIIITIIMPKELLKKNIPSSILYKLLKKVCKYENDKYIWNKVSYKLSTYHNYIDDFCKELKPFYHEKTQFYLERKQNNYRFLTIIRQICNANKIGYIHQFEYAKSDYEIVYIIDGPSSDIYNN